ncbi:MAG: ABC transporter ATP-binding protein [Ignavibacteriae bacterium]|nr:MAG: ABC transporter ATP-binding protein [Ignavibacteriota bacterium]
MIQIKNLSKTYRLAGFHQRPVQALNDVSMDIRQGEIVAVLGLNGAGKTTLIKILLGLVRPTSGMASVSGKSVTDPASRNCIGYLPEIFRVAPHYTGNAILRFLGSSSGLSGARLQERMNYCLGLVDLKEAASQKVSSYSKGMVVRLGIAQAILHEPKILILDEPTDGLDPLGKVMIRTLLGDLAKDGITIIINSHLLSEVEYVAHRVAILHHGKLIRWGALSEIIPLDSKYVFEFPEPVSLPGPWECRQTGGAYCCEVTTTEGLQGMLEYLRRNDIHSYSMKQVRATLEDVFLQYIKEP